MDSANLGASASVRVRDPKVTRVTNGDTASFFIPQPPPQQPPTTTSPTRNFHHHKHPQPPRNHDNRPTTTLDHHTPSSPATTTTSRPLPRHTTPTTSNNTGRPKDVNHPQRRPQAANDGQRPTSNIDRLATTKTANHGCRTTTTGAPTAPGLNGRAGTCRS